MFVVSLSWRDLRRERTAFTNILGKDAQATDIKYSMHLAIKDSLASNENHAQKYRQAKPGAFRLLTRRNPTLAHKLLVNKHKLNQL